MDDGSLHILLVEDNPTDALLLTEELQEVHTSKFVLTCITRLDGALASLHTHKFDLVLLDLGLPDSQGLETFARLQHEHPTIPILILSGLDDDALAVRAVQDGAQDYLVKGVINGTMLSRTIRYAIERKRAEQKLLASETGYRRLFETAQDGIFILDAETGQITDANPFLEQLLGYTVTEFIGKRLWEIAPFRNKKASQAAFATLQETGYIRYDALPLTTKDGQQVEVEFVSNIYAVGNHQVIQCNIRDITERRHAEAGLQESETRKTAIFETALDCIISMDETGRVIEFNAAAEKTFGYTPDEAIGQLLADLIIPPALREHHQRGLAHFLATGEGSLINKRIEVAAMRADGTEFPAELAVSPVHLGERTIFTGYLRDITSRKQAEAALQESQTQLRSVIQSLDDIVFEFDRQGHYINVWTNDETLLARPKAELIGSLIVDILGQEIAEPFLAAFERVLDSGQTEDMEYELEVMSGNRCFLARISQIPNPEGSHQTVSMLSRDITERKQAEEQLRFQKALLEAQTEASPSGILVVSGEGNILSFNQRFLQMWGIPQQIADEKDDALALQSVLDKLVTPQQFLDKVAYLYEHQDEHSDEQIALIDGRVFNRYSAPVTGADGLYYGRVWYFSDITERKQSEELLRASETRYRSLFESNPHSMWVYDRATLDFLAVNDAAIAHYGYSKDEFLSMTIKDIRPPEDIPALMAWDSKPSPPDGKHGNWRHCKKDGTVIAVEITTHELSFDERPADLVLAHDVTERNLAEKALRDSEQRFQNIVANVPGMVYQFALRPDGTTEFPFVSEGSRELFEMEPEDIQLDRDSPVQLIDDAHRAGFDRSVAESAAALTPWSWEGYFRLPSGKSKWIQGASRPQRLPHGGTLWDGLLMDITARKEAEEERDRFFTLSLDMLAIIGSDGYMKRLNPAFEATLGFSGAEMMAVPFLEFVHPDDHDVTAQGVARLEGGLAVTDFENRYRCRDGSYKWLSWTVAPYEKLWYCVARDITDTKKAEATLHKANDELELHVAERTAELAQVNQALRAENIERQMALNTLREVTDVLEQAKEAAEHASREAETANLAKSEFLSRMSHELRTPLNAILGFGQVLDRQKMPSRQKESLQFILKGGRHLLDLINEVLDIARVEAGHVEMSTEAIAVADIVTECCNLVGPLAMESNIRINDNIASLGDVHVLADRQRLKQVLINLLANGIKYNRPGGQVDITCHPASNEMLHIAVRDTGPGISAEGLAKLFTPFERLDAANSNVEGTGLGLVLSQRLVVAMGGTLEVESTPGEGSTFTIVLPQVAAPVEALSNLMANGDEAVPRMTTGNQYRVLCIEDNLPNLRLIEAILESRPEITLLSAAQGSIGLDLARHHEPDLILLDLHLPDIPGKEVLSRLQQSALTKDIPVVVISADATPSQIERMLEAGVVAFLTKPLDVAEFLRTLDQTLQGREARADNLRREELITP